jgi:hypothetical protein
MPIPGPINSPDELVGFKVIVIATGQVLQTYGPSYPPPSPPSFLILPNGDVVHSPVVNVDYGGIMMIEMRDSVFLPEVEAVTFMERFTIAEYIKTKETSDAKVHLFWDIMLARGKVDVTSPAGLRAKQHWIDEGLLEQDRADIIWRT